MSARGSRALRLQDWRGYCRSVQGSLRARGILTSLLVTAKQCRRCSLRSSGVWRVCCRMATRHSRAPSNSTPLDKAHESAHNKGHPLSLLAAPPCRSHIRQRRQATLFQPWQRRSTRTHSGTTLLRTSSRLRPPRRHTRWLKVRGASDRLRVALPCGTAPGHAAAEISVLVPDLPDSKKAAGMAAFNMQNGTVLSVPGHGQGVRCSRSPRGSPLAQRLPAPPSTPPLAAALAVQVFPCDWQQVPPRTQQAGVHRGPLDWRGG